MSVLAPRADWFARAVRSVLEQTFADFELIVLEDPAPASIEGELERLRDPRIRFARNEVLMSLARSRMCTLAMARADLVAIMDADDVAHPQRLEQQCAFLAAHPDVDVVGSQIAVIGADGALRGYRPYPLAHRDIVAAMRRFNPLAHPTVMARKSAVLAAGGYAELAGGTCDDYELWSRMATRGHRFANLPEALLQYRMHDSSTKARRLRQTLHDTLWIKRRYWRDQLSVRDRLRMAGENALLWLPAALVARLFLRIAVRPHLRIATTGAATS
jgi:glycosyltransferase involved in cell wall biosynthesis